MGEFLVIGTGVPRTDAVEKVTGRALYTADLVLRGMIYGINVHDTAKFRPKTSANGHANDAKAVQRDTQRPCDIAADDEMPLCRSPDGDFASLVYSGYRHLWLNVGLVDAMDIKLVLKHIIALCKALFHIAFSVMAFGDDIEEAFAIGTDDGFTVFPNEGNCAGL